MAGDYNGLTRNTWPGTWSASASHPIVLDSELRGSLRSIAGTSGSRLTDITGQRLEEGMLVYVKTGYTVGAVTRKSNTYYQYTLLVGQTRDINTGACPNSEANWSEFVLGATGSTGGSTGATGSAGGTGPTGVRGTAFYYGTDVTNPQGPIVNPSIGDIFLNTVTGELYVKLS